LLCAHVFWVVGIDLNCEQMTVIPHCRLMKRQSGVEVPGWAGLGGAVEPGKLEQRTSLFVVVISSTIRRIERSLMRNGPSIGIEAARQVSSK
jgi:hypothetical protein